MKKLFAGFLMSALWVSAALGAPAGDVTAPIHQFIDGFNTGDFKSAYATYATGEIAIVDEFAPHRWIGPDAAHAWAAAYDKHAAATGVTDGIVKYGEPTRTQVESDMAYVVIPAVYSYKEHGAPIVEDGQFTFVLHVEGGAWKIQGWTWTGTKPRAGK